MDQLIQEFDQYCNSITEGNQKYGRDKLFNTKAMKLLVDESPFLTNQYDKLNERGKEIFGYHYNEIILSFIFIKFILNDKKMFDKYKRFRKMILRKQRAETLKSLTPDEREIYLKKREEEDTYDSIDKLEIDEMDSMSVGNTAYSTPVAFAKDKSNWRHLQSQPYYKGAKIIEPNTGTHIQGINSFKVKKTLEENVDKISKDDIMIEEINDMDYNQFKRQLYRKSGGELYLPDVLKVEFFIDHVDFPEDVFETEIVIEDLKNDFNILDFDDTQTIIELNETKIIEEYILNNLDNIINFEEMEKTTNQDLNEHHLTSRGDLINFISDKTGEDAKKLSKLSDEALEKKYKKVEKDLGLNEESKHAALVHLDNVNKQNKSNEEDYFKELNKGVQDQIDSPEEGGYFEYEYDVDSMDKKEIPKYDQSEEPLKKYVELNRGRTPLDLDYDVDPGKAYWDRIKNMVGDEEFDLMKKKQDLRQKQRDYATKGKFMKPDEQDQSEERKELVGLSESTKILGKYKNILGDNKFVKINPNEINHVTSLNESWVKISTEGLGNTLSGKVEHGEFVKLNENEQIIKKYQIYLDENDNKFYAIEKKKTSINENVINKFKKSINFKYKN